MNEGEIAEFTAGRWREDAFDIIHKTHEGERKWRG